MPVVPPLTVQDPGHLTVAQRGVALDRYDRAVIQPGAELGGVSPEMLREDFGLFVINMGYAEAPWNRCLPPEIPDLQLRARLDALVEYYGGLDVQLDQVAVNASLLTPGGSEVQYVCGDPDDPPRFDAPEHRDAVLDAFRALAASDRVAWITVGVQLDHYAHAVGPDLVSLAPDYTHLASLYRAIYIAIKAVNEDIRVGPGIDWSTFRLRSMPRAAEALGLEEAHGLEAAAAAFDSTIRPLVEGDDGARMADYLGVSVIPVIDEPPWLGGIGVDGDPRQQQVFEAFRWLPLVLGRGGDAPLPLVMPRIDWPSEMTGSPEDAQLMQVVKRVAAGLDLAWAAWWRLSALPSGFDESPCAAVTRGAHPAMRYPAHFCAAGMIDETGARSPMWPVFMVDP